jgi:predicted transcriptional regulator
MQDRIYQRKKQLMEKFIKKHGKRVNRSLILNEVDVDYDTLMKILSELSNEGHLR